MKRFSILSLATAAAISAAACGYTPVTRYYIYYTPSPQGSWYERQFNGMADEWTHLLGRKITADDVQDIPWSTEYFANHKDNPILAAALTGDAELLRYLFLVATLSGERFFSYDSWDYPSKEKIAEHEANLRNVRSAAEGYSGQRLARQYRLMAMRAAFMQKDYKACEKMWQEAPKDNSIFTEMMRNLYAGVLYRTDRKQEAFAIYSSQGDEQSASWCAAKTGTVEGIRQFYDENPNSGVLPFLIGEFCNNTQETIDVLDDNEAAGNGRVINKDALDWIGAREINRKAAADFIRLAEEAATNSAVEDKAMWLNAAALVDYYYGNLPAAAQLLQRAQTAASTPDSKKGTEYISIFVEAASTKDDKKLAAIAPKMITQLTSDFDNLHSRRMLLRLVHTVLEPRFAKAGMYRELLSSLIAIDDVDLYITSDSSEMTEEEKEWNKNWFFNPDYSTDYFANLDTIPTEAVIDWAGYISRGGEGDWSGIVRKEGDQTHYLNDLIGTRLLRRGQFEEAREYLAKVPVSFLEEQNIAPYAAVRSFTKLPWLVRREKSSEGKRTTLKRNAKLDYCDYMLSLRKNPATSENLMQEAGAYYIASKSGSCWWLTDYHWSFYPESVRKGDLDFAKRARQLVDRAKTAQGKVKPVEILYAEAFMATDELFTYDWDKGNILNRNSQAYASYSALANTLRTLPTPPPYISRCDVLRDFLKRNK